MTAPSLNWRQRVHALVRPLLPVTDAIGPIGLDFSKEALHAAQFRQDQGALTLDSVASARYPMPRSQLFKDSKRLRATVDQVLRRGGFSGRSVVTCMPPNKVQLSMINYRLDSGQDEEQLIASLAAEQLEGDNDQWIVDFVRMRTGDGDRDRASLLACAARHQVVSHLDALTGSRLQVEALEIGPVALGRLVTSVANETPGSTVLIVNVGERKTYMTVFSGRRLALERNVVFGEADIARLLSENLELDAQASGVILQRYGVDGTEAERLGANRSSRQDVGIGRIGTGESLAGNAGTGDTGTGDTGTGDTGTGDTDTGYSGTSDSGAANPGTEMPSFEHANGDVPRVIQEITKHQFVSLAREIETVAIYSASQLRGAAIDHIYLVGSITRWPGADRVLAKLLALPVSILDPLKLYPPTRQPTGEPMSRGGLAVATGCALRGLLDG